MEARTARATPTVEDDRSHAGVIVECVAQIEVEGIQAIARLDVVGVDRTPGDAEAWEHRGRHPHRLGSSTPGRAVSQVWPNCLDDAEHVEELPLQEPSSIQ
jgi:hypothetical protein